MVDLSQYTQTAANWREQIRKNQSKSRQVVILFILLYAVVGIVVDVLIYNAATGAPPELILKALFTGKIWPYATLSMAGVACLSLLITYAFYDKIMLMGTEYHEITSDATDLQEKQLYNVVEEMKVAAGLQFLPKIYLIDADYMNAFASGFSEKSAMVAITRGLLAKLDRNELQAVMAHELSHIRHLDIKLTLTVAILTNLMLMVVDIIFYNLIFGGRRKVDQSVLIIAIALRYGLPLITVLLTLYLSRTREYMADAGCVELMRNNEPLARALLKIQDDHEKNHDEYRKQYGQTAHEEVRRAAYLFDPVKAGIEPVHNISSLFSTHPTIADRLKAIGFKLKGK
ncbi:MAG: zinc metalloprotease HtpX [Proteobacteria bacterium]|nr:zinc metalloprotease HtpX [Pseudomonadota bacterium]